MEDPLLSLPITSPDSINAQKEEPTTVSTFCSFSTTQILLRLTAVLSIAAVCLWASHVASSSFEISIVNSAHDSYSGRRFDLMFVSTGKISRIFHQSNQLIEQALYPNISFPKKPLSHVTLHLSSHNLSELVSVQSGVKTGEFTVVLSPSLVLTEKPGESIESAVFHAMTRVRVWDGQEELVEAIMEYLATENSMDKIRTVGSGSGGQCWSGELLRYWERRESGFVARLNRRIRDRSGSVLLNQTLCDAYKKSLTSQQ